MRLRLYAIILSVLLLFPSARVSADAIPSDWPSIGADAAQSNDNLGEHVLSAKNVLKLKVRWTAPIATESYPVVAGGEVFIPFVAGSKIHVHALDAVTGKLLITYPKDALGGLLADGGTLYLAGHVLQSVDVPSGKKLWQIDASPALKGGTFLDPVGNDSFIVAGYASTTVNGPSRLYGVNPRDTSVLWKLPSASAVGTLAAGTVLTETEHGSSIYDAANGKIITSHPGSYGQWFSGSSQSYTVASGEKAGATLYAYDRTGHKVWKRVIGPRVVSSNWPHAVSETTVFIRILKPYEGIAALDPATGDSVWESKLANVEQLVLANGLIYVLSYGLGEPVRIAIFEAATGKAMGAIVLSTGYYAFNEPNGLMVADGMVFVRVGGPAGPVLVALSPATARG
jgi:hypothetical protein